MVDTLQTYPGTPLAPRQEAKLPVVGTLKATVRTFWQAPWKLVALLFVPLPFQILAAAGQFFFAKPGSSPSTLAIAAFVAIYLLQYLVLLVVIGALYAAGSRLMEQRQFFFGDVLGVGVRRLLPLLGALIILSAAIGLGFLLLIIPGIFLSLMWAVALPACVIEGLGPIKCLGRSRFLTRDNRWRVLGAFLLIGLLPIAIVYAIGFALVLTKVTVLMIIGGLELVIGGIAIGAMVGTFPAVMFHELRIIKEGGAVGGVSRVFD